MKDKLFMAVGNVGVDLWISASEPLPELGKKVLCFCQDCGEEWFEVGKVVEYNFGKEWEMGESSRTLHYVTHWINLPSRPIND